MRVTLLEQVGHYFRMAEPSSPIPFLTDRARDLAQRDFLSVLKALLPAGTTPKELDVAIKRLEAGEDPEKIEEDMGDLLGDFMGGPDGGSGGGGYTHDSGLYDY